MASNLLFFRPEILTLKAGQQLAFELILMHSGGGTALGVPHWCVPTQAASPQEFQGLAERNVATYVSSDDM